MVNAERLAKWVYATSDVTWLKVMRDKAQAVLAKIPAADGELPAESFPMPTVDGLAVAADANFNARTPLTWIDSLSKPLDTNGKTAGRVEEIAADRAAEVATLRRLLATLNARLGA